MSSSASSLAPAAAASPHPCDVFLSHNSADYFAAAALEQRLARAGLRPWLAASQLIPGRPWQEAMERALAQSETVAVIIGPQGMGPWHNEQMRVAIDDAVRQGKGVIPVLLPGADPERINPFLKRRTWVDFRGGLENAAAFQLLLAGIRGETPFEAGDLFGLAWARRKDFYRHIPYPTNFVPRPDLLAEVRQALLADTAALALTSAIKMDALHGMGGIGKSVMARALCDDPGVQAAFPDGILWTTLGQTPELIPRLREWIDTLGGTVSEIAPTVDRLKAILADLLRERACLLIVDDAWKKAHAEAFRVGGPRCRLLLTTRDAALADDLGATVHPVPVMTEPKAMELLEEWALGGLQGAAPELKGKIVRRLGRLPLAIKLAGAQLQRQEVDQWLASFDARKLKARRVEDAHDSLAATFGLSLDELAPADRRLYVALSIFREDEPLAVLGIARLWSALDGRDGNEMRELLGDLAARALVDRSPGDDDAIRIHDLLRDFTAAELGDEGRITAHRTLLNAYRSAQEGNGWHTAPDDGYLYNHLAYHLDQLADHDAVAEAELHGLFANQTWMHARVAQSGYLYDGYIDDLEATWRRVQEATQRQIDAGEEASLLADCVRYALICTTINSLAANYVPSLVARAVETGIWPAERALSVGKFIPDPFRRVALYLSLLEVKSLTDDQRQTASCQALAATQAIRTEAIQVATLGDLVPHLNADLLTQAMAIARAMPSDPLRLHALALIASSPTWETQSQVVLDVLTEVLTLDDVSLRAKFMALLIPHIDSELQQRVLRNEFSTVCTVKSERQRTETLTALAPLLTGQLARAGMAEIQGILDEENRVRALSALAPNLGGELAEQALAIVNSVTSAPLRGRALSVLAPSLSVEMIERAVVIAYGVDHPRGRAEALVALVPYVLKDTQGKVLSEGLNSARQIADHRQRAETLLTLLPYLSKEVEGQVLCEVQTAVDSICDMRQRALVLAQLASHLEGDAQDRVVLEGLIAAEACGTNQQRSSALSDMATQLRGHLLQNALKTARTIPDAGDRLKALITLAPYLPREARDATLQEGWAIAGSIESSWERTQALLVLARQLAGESREPVLRDALISAQNIQDANLRARIMAVLAQELSGNARGRAVQQGLDAAWAIKNPRSRVQALAEIAVSLTNESRDAMLLEILAISETIVGGWEVVQALVALTPHLTGTLREQVVQKGLTTAIAIQSNQQRARAMVALAPELSDETRDFALQQGLEAAEAIDNHRSRAQTLADLIHYLPCTARERALHEALAAAKAIQAEDDHAQAMTALAPYLTKDLVSEALAATKAIKDERYRAHVLVALKQHLTDDLLEQGLEMALAIGIDRYRMRVLAALAPNYHNALPYVWKAIADVLWDHAGDKQRKSVLNLCSHQHLVAPPIMAPTTLAAIASHIIEICQEWEWL